VLVAAVPWARHDAGFTRAFEDQTAWLAVNTSKTAICLLMRIAWRTVGRICERVSTEAASKRDLFANLKRLGFDEISVRKGQRYLTVVVDHHTGRLVWRLHSTLGASASTYANVVARSSARQRRRPSPRS
jgi:transposase